MEYVLEDYNINKNCCKSTYPKEIYEKVIEHIDNIDNKDYIDQFNYRDLVTGHYSHCIYQQYNRCLLEANLKQLERRNEQKRFLQHKNKGEKRVAFIGINE